MGYMRQLTPEEVREHDERVKALHQSGDLTRNIAAVLMDVKIGSAGDHERGAMTKARAIVNMLRKRGLVPPRPRAGP